MGPKCTGKNKKVQMKKTSTPLNNNDAENMLPTFENISTIKVLRNRNVLFNSESTQTRKTRSKASSQTILNSAVTSKKSCEPRRDFAVSSKISFKLRPDTPLKPRKNSQQPNSLAFVQKKLKFSRASNSPNQRFKDCSIDNCLLDGKCPVGIAQLDSAVLKESFKLRPDTPLKPRKSSQQFSSLAFRKKLNFSRASNSPNQRFDRSKGNFLLDGKCSVGIDDSSRRQLKTGRVENFVTKSSRNQDEFHLNDSTVLIEVPICNEEQNNDKTLLSGDILHSSLDSKKLQDKDPSEHQIEENILQKPDFEVNTVDTSNSIEICRRDASSFELSTAINSFHLDLLSDNTLEENCYNVLNLEAKDVIPSNYANDVKKSGMLEHKNDPCSAKSTNLKAKLPLRSSRLKKFQKGSNSNVPKDDCFHIKKATFEGDIENILKVKSLLNKEETLKVLKNANGKEIQSSLCCACNCNESSCTKCTKGSEVQNQGIAQLDRVLESRLDINCSKNDKIMRKKDKGPKAKSKIAKTSKKKYFKSKNVPSYTRMKRNKATPKGIFSFPSTSTPVSGTEISHKDLDRHFESSSLCNEARMENPLENFILDDLRITEQNPSKIYGKILKTRQMSEASRRWEILVKKGRGHHVQKGTTKTKTRNLKNTINKSKCSLFLTPPVKLLENVPIDEGLRLRTKSELRKKRNNTKNGGKTSKTRSRRKLHDSKMLQKLSSHFDDISKYSLVIEIES